MLEECGLSDARLSGDDERSASGGPGASDQGSELFELMISASEDRGVCCSHGVIRPVLACMVGSCGAEYP